MAQATRTMTDQRLKLEAQLRPEVDATVSRLEHHGFAVTSLRVERVGGAPAACVVAMPRR